VEVSHRGAAGERGVRKLPSGYQARYLGPDGLVRAAPETFACERDAERNLALVDAQLARKEWTDPAGAGVRLSEYAEGWIAHQRRPRPRTPELHA
jgi:hypothetical protein